MNSLIPIATAVILAMETDHYIIAGGFFALSLMVRAAERKEEKQWQRELIEEKVRQDIKKEED